ncbi:hypothetical protein AAFF_G00131310 [Aldrovandia affinis]|uniref:Uncharacterized protein n=1 Tax=Aldrovandia affinis TaxID=143900 RepID=A0AAD7W9C6_9TELE|nr:hypothetical protein AAFF_G00131310 [Aldrovandia affinis]
MQSRLSRVSAGWSRRRRRLCARARYPARCSTASILSPLPLALTLPGTCADDPAHGARFVSSGAALRKSHCTVMDVNNIRVREGAAVAAVGGRG